MTGEVSYTSPNGIEQSRRDFMRDYPDLYLYIVLRGVDRALDQLGDSLSGYDQRAANETWGAAGAARGRWKSMNAADPAVQFPITDSFPTKERHD